MKGVMDRLKASLTPREGTDLQSEILDVVSAPIYVYTITSVYIHWFFFVLPYHYGGMYGRTDTWAVIFHRIFMTFVYFEMMSNWLCARYVQNSCDPKKVVRSIQSNGHNLESVHVDGYCPSPTLNQTNTTSDVIPKPKGAPEVYKKPYWSWKRCDKCDIIKPPRCHHCPMCKTCILKRDHHCFFTGRCVGFFNQRYFLVFCCWASLGTSYAALHFVPYFYHVIWPTIHPLDIVAPLGLMRLLLADGSLYMTNLMFTVTLLFFFVCLSTSFILNQIGLISSGLTSFERDYVDHSKLKICDPRPLQDKIRAVFGLNWAVSFLVPLWHLKYPPHENPYEWPEVKVYRTGK